MHSVHVYKAIAVWATIIAVSLVAWLAYQNNYGSSEEEMTFCTQEAKQCPDGSYVGREGPNCEFKACPEVIDSTDWKIFQNKKYKFEILYPGNATLTGDFYNDLHSYYNSVQIGDLIFYVEALESYNYSDYPDIKLPINEFAKNIWSMNVNDTNPHVQNKRIGEFIQIEQSGDIFYMFTVRGSYIDPRQQSVVDGEKQIIFTENKGIKFKIVFDNAQLMQKVFSTFKFIQ